VSGFTQDWLTLREPADRSARSVAVTECAVAQLTARGSRPVRVLDLATGTGANVRFLAPMLPMPQEWRVVDRDVGLLAALPQHLAAWALGRACRVSGDPGGFTVRGDGTECLIETRTADLSKLRRESELKRTQSLQDSEGLFVDRALVTASALLDLVSERWLQALVDRCRVVRAVGLFALTYDGRLSCEPVDSDDEFIRERVNRHQKTAKSFGRALGPDATAHAARYFRDAGYDVRIEPSDWTLVPSQSALQEQLIAGWAAAAAEIDGRATARVSAWKKRRLEQLAAGTSHVTVGHQDLVAWPRETLN
jgi:hypothetical protein